MIKEVIGTGETVQEALEKAKAELGIDVTTDYEQEVIQLPEKKKFGLFGGKEAKVKVSVEVPDEKPAQVEPAPPKTEKKQNKPAPKADKKEESAKAEDKPADKKDNSKAADAAEKFLRDVIAAMDLNDLTIEAEKSEDKAVFNIEGEDVGYIIGRRGETLDALQYLTSLVANHVDNSYFKITVNTGNYREKREKTLEILGRKLAFKAVKTGKKTSLEPMNPYERRIIHTAVQKVRGATSWSEGEGTQRHVVIGTDGKSRSYRGGRQGGRRGGQGRSSRPAPAPNPDRKPLDESNGAALFGRIEK